MKIQKKIILTLLFLQSLACAAQHMYSLGDDQPYMDSLVKVLRVSKSDSLKCMVSLYLCNAYRRNLKPERATLYLQKAALFQKNNAYLKDYSAYFHAARFLTNGDYVNYDKALLKANERLKKYTDKNSYRMRGIVLANHAIMRQVDDNEKEAIQILTTEAMAVAFKSGDNELISGLYKTLGIIYMNYPDRVKADFYLNQAVGYMEKPAPAFSPTLQETKVETYILNAENLIELDKFAAANLSLEKAFAILKKYPNSNLNGAYYYSKGSYFNKLGFHNEAIKNYDIGIANCIRHNSLFTKFRLLFAKQQALFKQKKYLQSEKILTELIQTNTYFSTDRKNYYKDLAEVYEKLGDIFKANTFHRKYITISDSLYEATYKKEIAQIEAQFNKSENENKIKRLQTEKQKAQLVADNSKLRYVTFGLLSAVLLITLIYVLLIFKNQRKMANERESVERRNFAVLKRQKEIDVMQAMIDGEELERKRIARDLHDGIGSKLSALKIMLSRLRNQDTDDKALSNITEMLTASISELRQISHNLIPESLLKLGLETALSDLCHLLHSEETKIEFQSYKIQKNIPLSSQINIFRIVQELINNALKHAECSEILVSCSQNTSAFFIAVEDNGKGFDLEKLDERPGLGIKNLKSRVEMLNGLFHIDSNESGTYYNIEVNL